MTDEAFAEWLRDHAGVAESRRIARRDSQRMLVSKFPEGFAGHLHEALARLPELFETTAVTAAHCALTSKPGVRRVEAWHESILGLLRNLGSERNLSPDEQAEIRAGIDSVAALLDSILWTSPLTGAPYAPAAAETEAYREAISRMDAPDGMFTRFYGVFEGLRVENHCPGAPFARKLLAQAWTICTGTPAPA